MIILHVLNSLMVGGREKIVVDLCNTIDFNKNKVIIVTFSNTDNTLASMLNKEITLIELPFANSKIGQSLNLWFFGFSKLIRIFNNIKPDVIHNHLYYHHFLFLALCTKVSKFSTVNFRTVHTSGLFYNSNSLMDKFRLMVEKIATRISNPHIISVSKAAHLNCSEFFGNVCRSNTLVPNGINLDNFNRDKFDLKLRKELQFKEDDIIGIYVSRLDHGKNHKILIDVWKEISAFEPKAKLVLLGDGPLGDKIKVQLIENDLTKNVLLLGYSTLVGEYLSISDFGVFPSSFEGFPISLIEKMAMGLPVLVSNIDAFDDIIIHNENGKFFSLDSKQSFVNEIKDMMIDTRKRKLLGIQAHKSALKYDINNISNRLLILYKRALSRI